MSIVPGSLSRRMLFWAHLGSGVAAGLVILAVSITGTLLTYERQVVESAARSNRLTSSPASPVLSADQLAEFAHAAAPKSRRLNLVFDADPQMPVSASRGREAPLLLDPHSGLLLHDSSASARDFMRTVENWHRWLGGNGTSTRATIVDIANLLFLFMTLSGIYLWLPAVWRWRTLRGLMLFRSRYLNAKLREFSWHHVFGFWAVVPLLLITLSGVVMSFDWANRLVFAAYGEAVPQRRAPEGEALQPPASAPRSRATLDTLLATARSQVQGWQRLTIPVGGVGASVEVVAEVASDSGRPSRRTLTLDAFDASVISLSSIATPSAGQRARTWLRFVHTGEQYGVVGQTIAGLASIAACFLVYSGLALAFRRLIAPLWRRDAPTG